MVWTWSTQGWLDFLTVLLGQYINNSGWREAFLSNLTSGLCTHSLFSWVPDYAGAAFHMHLLLRLWLCFKIMRPAWTKLLWGRSRLLPCSIILGFGLWYSHKVLLSEFPCSLACHKCRVSPLMGETFLYWIGILKCGFQCPSGGSAGRNGTYICPLLKGHSFGDDLFYRIICPEELGKGIWGSCIYSPYKE